MKFISAARAAVAAATICLLTSSCIGSFGLSKKILAWNKQVGNKVVNELVFIGFNIVPVYLVGLVADLLILNSIEFWSGKNPAEENIAQTLRGSDGREYLVESSEEGYRITSLEDGAMLNLDFDAETRTWSTLLADGTRYDLLTFVDDEHVKVADGCGGMVEMSLLSPTLIADYRAIVGESLMASR